MWFQGQTFSRFVHLHQHWTYCTYSGLTWEGSSWLWMCCTLQTCVMFYVCMWWLWMCCRSLCVWREPNVSRFSDYQNNLSLLSFLSLNPRWGCSSGTRRDRSASGASFPVTYETPLWLWLSTTLQVGVPHVIMELCVVLSLQSVSN